jgi:hypothetical protein
MNHGRCIMQGKQVLVAVLLLALLFGAVVGLSMAQEKDTEGSAAPQTPMGTHFTYQGQLNKNGSPVTEDIALGVLNQTVQVNRGLFTAELDFGSAAFTGAARWLGVRVKCSGDTVYADLGRQELTAGAYSLYALSAGSAEALQGYPVSNTVPSAGQALTWDGSQWAPAALAKVPAGAVMFFALTDCPAGWTQYASAEGRYLVGLDPAHPGDLEAAVGTALGNKEDKVVVGQHTHGITDAGHSHGITDGGHKHPFYDDYVSAAADNVFSGVPLIKPSNGLRETSYSTTGIRINSALTGITINQAGTTTGTNAPYLQLLVCRKD